MVVLALAIQNTERSEEEEEAAVIKLSMRTLKEHYGLNPGKFSKPTRDIGYQLGIELFKRVTKLQANHCIEDVVSELNRYWVQNGIGEISWYDRDNLLLAIQYCSDCLGRGYGAGYTLCPFKEGLIEAVLESALGGSFSVKEIECCGTQASNCLFKIESI